MSRLNVSVLVSVCVLLSVAPVVYGADVTVGYDTTFCFEGEPCTLDVWISSYQMLGRVAVVLRFDNTKLIAINVTRSSRSRSTTFARTPSTATRRRPAARSSSSAVT
jgi:hypothetical protein